ncbi:BamA/TamA family outer membrane protein [Brevundimonas goettingensis]|uniref:Bacterial surface antigen (D15) domain-containing protein n=1 Tax=Brevundimonas goettingensis TaxID=2774190 RepID=A0A975C2C8_9CAUL|nr:hypothetical protein [Brevundimonas goettingensis]QTC92240.1 hypothetical protein IFJ75_04895 [Brevundimonas goettingensis]
MPGRQIGNPRAVEAVAGRARLGGTWVFGALFLSLAFQAAPVQAEPVAGPENREPTSPPPPQDAPEAGSTLATPRVKHSFFSQFIDPEDHALDFSAFLAKGGFIPAPIIITEPAVDGGGGVALAFFKANPEHPRQVTRHIIGAFRTGNGSEGLGYFQSGYAFDGRLNYRFGIGHGEVTLDTFPAFAPDGVEYTSQYDYGIVGSALWHFSDDRFSIGPVFDFRKLTSTINTSFLPEDVADDFGMTLQTGALGLGLHFDSRDNAISPTRGVNAYVEGKFNREAFGSDRDYEVYAADLYVFGPVAGPVRYGAKVQIDAIRDDFPFFYAPAVSLRGVQAAEYQGMTAVSTEVETTWQVSPRWALLAFAGYGSADSGDRRIFSDSGDIWAGGVGFRYRLARRLGMDAGADFAWGPGGFIWYLQFGHAWSFGMD